VSLPLLPLLPPRPAACRPRTIRAYTDGHPPKTRHAAERSMAGTPPNALGPRPMGSRTAAMRSDLGRT
jgi:hypothetical protein